MTDTSDIGHGIDRHGLARGARALANEYEWRATGAATAESAAKYHELADDYTVFAASLEAFDSYGAAILPSAQPIAETAAASSSAVHHG